MLANRSSYPQLTAVQCLDFAIEALRRDFLAQPEAKRKQTLARVRRLLEAEAHRKQNQPSWLKTHAKAIYGRDL